MSVSRRQFMRAGSVYAITAGLSLGLADLALGQKRTRGTDANGSFVVPADAQRDPLYYMTRQTFSQYVDTVFVIDPGYTFAIETKLVAVTDLRTAAEQKKNTPGRECFSLIFLAMEDRMLKQRTYQIRHQALGTFELFVVPNRDKQDRLYFEAVINRAVS